MISLDFFKKYKDFTTVLYFLKRHILIISILSTLMIFLFTGWVFYQYAYKPSFGEIEASPDKDLEIDRQLYQKVLSETEEKEKKFGSDKKQTFPDPFK